MDAPAVQTWFDVVHQSVSQVCFRRNGSCLRRSSRTESIWNGGQQSLNSSEQVRTRMTLSFHCCRPCLQLQAKRTPEVVERMDIEEVDAEVVVREICTEQAEWIARSQAQMFSVLSLLTRADTNQLVRSCDDKNEYVAWLKFL